LDDSATAEAVGFWEVQVSKPAFDFLIIKIAKGLLGRHDEVQHRTEAKDIVCLSRAVSSSPDLGLVPWARRSSKRRISRVRTPGKVTDSKVKILGEKEVPGCDILVDYSDGMEARQRWAAWSAHFRRMS
jgi:hypothetical protein